MDQAYIQQRFLRYIDKQLQDRINSKPKTSNELDYPITDSVFSPSSEMLNLDLVQKNAEGNHKIVEEIEKINDDELKGVNGLLEILETFLKVKQISKKTLFKILYGFTPDKTEINNKRNKEKT